MGVVTCICRDAYLLGQPGTRLNVAAFRKRTQAALPMRVADVRGFRRLTRAEVGQTVGAPEA
jgi:hypothetical protein